ncbi:hypothetical protein D9611_014932 [Ephemerocybe angulata]|uniref:Uncharacterized protein n=1 Tax=Ephemerocybe angulata TaxID=980116 RepID=A0A8H5BR92_9AGAR|nr:hypothetical protein D9611_014932 [Tulosesus angulatus]
MATRRQSRHWCRSQISARSNQPSIIIAALLPRHVFPNAHHLLILPLGHLPIEPNTAKEPISLRLYKVLSTNFDDAGGFGHALRALRDTSTGHLYGTPDGEGDGDGALIGEHAAKT